MKKIYDNIFDVYSWTRKAIICDVLKLVYEVGDNLLLLGLFAFFFSYVLPVYPTDFCYSK